MTFTKKSRQNIEAFFCREYEEHVPAIGAASTQYGEIVRLYNHLVYKYYNDGDVIGRVVTNSMMWIARELKDFLPLRERKALARLYRERYNDEVGGRYEAALWRLGGFLRRYLKENRVGLVATPYKDKNDD